MYPNNNLSVLPFYSDIRYQNHRRSYAYGEIYPLMTPSATLLPFQIIRSHRSDDIVTVLLRKKDGQSFADITQDMKVCGLRIIPQKPSLDKDVVLFPATVALATAIPDGMYYLELSDGVEQWVSDIFTVVQDVSTLLKVQWYDIEDLEMSNGLAVIYSDEYGNACFRNVVYLCTQLGKPEYTFSEEVSERDGYSFPEKQVSEKTYKCTFLAPEYMLDVMRFVRLSDYVRITDQTGQIYDCDSVIITPTWQTQGDLASVEMEFQTDTAVKRIGYGYSTRGGGDFNNDFNNDFN